jgi:hypothetical protein
VGGECIETTTHVKAEGRLCGQGQVSCKAENSVFVIRARRCCGNAKDMLHDHTQLLIVFLFLHVCVARAPLLVMEKI